MRSDVYRGSWRTGADFPGMQNLLTSKRVSGNRSAKTVPYVESAVFTLDPIA